MGASIEEGLYTKLSGTTAVSDIVAARIYPLLVPQGGTLPAIVYQRISGEHEHSHDGISGLATARFQITSIAATYTAAKALAEQVRIALDCKTGTWGTTDVQSSFLTNDTDAAYEPLPGSATGTVGISADYEFGYAEAKT